MSKLKSQVDRAGRSIAGLSAARKVAAAGLLAVMVATGFWLTRQAQRTALEPVLDQKFADADVVQISDHLRARGLPHEVREGRVLVPAERKLETLSDLIYADVLTGSTQSGFDAMIKQASVWDTPSKTDKLFNHAREVTLAGVISRFRGVRKATVIIDPTHERRINGSVTPSALVDIQTRAAGQSGSADANPRQLATAAVNAVTGAVSAMAREKVKVTIDGASYNVAAGEEFVGDVLERRQQCEQAYVAKVRQLLGYIPDVLISVSVDLNVQSQEEEKRTIDPEKYLHLETSVQTRTEQAEPLPGAVQQNSVLANAVPELAEPPKEVPRPASRSEETTSQFSTLTSETVQKTRTPAGKETVVSASVAVPRSWFVALYKRSSTKAQEPDDALLQPIIDARLGRIRNLVRTSLGLQDESDVTVEVYEDALPAASPPAAVAHVAAGAASVVASPAATLSVVSALARVKWQWWGYAGLGVMTLLMVSMMFRRGGGAMAAPQLQAAKAPLRVVAAATSIAAPAPMRAGVIDDDPDTQDLLRQVRDLAARQPDDAARVLRDWIYQD